MATQALPVDVTSTELLLWVFARINEHDVDSLRPVWTDETVEYFPDATCRGADEVAAYFSEKFAAIEGFHLDVLAIAEAGDDVLVHWRMTGRHVGTLLGVAATGKTLEIEGSDHSCSVTAGAWPTLLSSTSWPSHARWASCQRTDPPSTRR